MSTLQRLTRRQTEVLFTEGPHWTPRNSLWQAGRVWLDLEDADLVEWEQLQGGSDIRTGPGSHGGGWRTRLTKKGEQVANYLSTPLSVPCPIPACRADIDKMCKRDRRSLISADLYFRTNPHPARVQAWKAGLAEILG